MINALPLQERPRERLMNLGAEALSVRELLAIILGSGVKGKSVLNVAEELIISFGGPKAMMEASYEDLMCVEGIGQAKALQLKAAFAFALRTLSAKDVPKPLIEESADAYAILRPYFWGKKTELIYLILRDTRGRMIGLERIASGTLTQVIAHPRELFATAIKRSAFSIIIAHNHPSGDPTPSSPDIDLTERLESAGRILGIRLDDHLVVGGYEFTSLFARGYLEERGCY